MTDDQQAPPDAPAGSGDLLRRGLARLLDEIIVGIILGLSLFAAGASFESLVFRVAPTVVLLAYYLYFEVQHATTPAKLLLGLRLSSTEGRRVTVRQSFVRNWWIVFHLVPQVGLFLVLGVAIYIAITISDDARNRGFHDRMAGTLVMLR